MITRIFLVIAIGVVVSSSFMFLEAVTAQPNERRGVRRPSIDPQPRAAVRKLCAADRLYRLADIEQAVAQIRGRGCEEVTLQHIEAGFYLFSGTYLVVGE